MLKPLLFLLLLPLVVFSVAYFAFHVISGIRLQREAQRTTPSDRTGLLLLVRNVLLITAAGALLSFGIGMVFGIIGVGLTSLAQYPSHLSPALAFRLVGLPVGLIGMLLSFSIATLVALLHWERGTVEGKEKEDEGYAPVEELGSEEDQEQPPRAA